MTVPTETKKTTTESEAPKPKGKAPPKKLYQGRSTVPGGSVTAGIGFTSEWGAPFEELDEKGMDILKLDHFVEIRDYDAAAPQATAKALRDQTAALGQVRAELAAKEDQFRSLQTRLEDARADGAKAAREELSNAIEVLEKGNEDKAAEIKALAAKVANLETQLDTALATITKLGSAGEPPKVPPAPETKPDAGAARSGQ